MAKALSFTSFILAAIAILMCVYNYQYIRVQEKNDNQSISNESINSIFGEVSELKKEVILINYKLDEEKVFNSMSSVVPLVYKNPTGLCKAIKQTQNDQFSSHTYFEFKTLYENLDVKYGKYKNDIEFIKDNLEGINSNLNKIKTVCNEIGYNIP